MELVVAVDVLEVTTEEAVAVEPLATQVMEVMLVLVIAELEILVLAAAAVAAAVNHLEALLITEVVVLEYSAKVATEAEAQLIILALEVPGVKMDNLEQSEESMAVVPEVLKTILHLLELQEHKVM